MRKSKLESLKLNIRNLTRRYATGCDEINAPLFQSKKAYDLRLRVATYNHEIETINQTIVRLNISNPLLHKLIPQAYGDQFVKIPAFFISVLQQDNLNALKALKNHMHGNTNSLQTVRSGRTLDLGVKPEQYTEEIGFSDVVSRLANLTAIFTDELLLPDQTLDAEKIDSNFFHPIDNLNRVLSFEMTKWNEQKSLQALLIQGTQNQYLVDRHYGLIEKIQTAENPTVARHYIALAIQSLGVLEPLFQSGADKGSALQGGSIHADSRFTVIRLINHQKSMLAWLDSNLLKGDYPRKPIPSPMPEASPPAAAEPPTPPQPTAPEKQAEPSTPPQQPPLAQTDFFKHEGPKPHAPVILEPIEALKVEVDTNSKDKSIQPQLQYMWDTLESISNPEDMLLRAHTLSMLVTKNIIPDINPKGIDKNSPYVKHARLLLDATEKRGQEMDLGDNEVFRNVLDDCRIELEKAAQQETPRPPC